MKKDQSSEQVIQSWARFKNLKKWKAVVAVLESRRDEADKVINTVGADNGTVYTERDIAVIKKEMCTALIELPQKIIDYYTDTGSFDTEEFDPFDDSTMELLTEDEFIGDVD